MMPATAALLSLFPAIAAAQPIAVVSGSGTTITLTDEPCAIEAVSNLPKRATWVDTKGKFEGCWGSQGPVVLAYFEDKSVVAIPAAILKAAEAI